MSSQTKTSSQLKTNNQPPNKKIDSTIKHKIKIDTTRTELEKMRKSKAFRELGDMLYID